MALVTEKRTPSRCTSWNEHVDDVTDGLSYANSRGAQLEPYVTTSLVQLLCRTTKLCWFDDDHFKTIVDDAKSLLAKGSSGLPVWPPLTLHFFPAQQPA